MTTFHAVILGIIQGLTEFFPVSSSGHLILLPKIFGWEEHSLSLDAFLHLGTGLAVLFYFRKDWIKMLSAFLADVKKVGLSFTEFSADSKQLLFLAAASVPAAVAGAFLNNWVEANLRSPMIVAVALVTVAILMVLAERNSFSLFRHSGLLTRLSFRAEAVDPESDGKKILNPSKASPRGEQVQDDTNIDLITTVKVGLSQTIALIPGVSRSGITITTGLFSGLDLGAAAKFSFLLSTPIVLGAGLWGLIGIPQTALRTPQIIAGFSSAFFSGLLAIEIFLSFVEKAGLLPFAIYRILLAAVVWFLFI